MYLYKAPCADIPTPKPKGAPKPERGPSKLRKPDPADVPYPTTLCWGGLKPSSPQEAKRLEEFLCVHGLTLQDSVQAETGMAYRSFESRS
ncbi:voltage-gated potassium channel subunit beta-1 isoform X2 [Arapaima gigas]